MNELQNIIGDYPTFLAQMLKEMVDAGFDMDDFVQMDHMCYRVSSLEAYATKKQELATVGKLLSEAQIGGRPIAVYRFNEPICYRNWRIDAIEIPAPKDGVETAEGLEHVEFVLYDDMPTFLEKYADKQFDLQSANRDINPEIGYKLPSCNVKFHLLNLPTAVYLQQKLGVM